MKLRDGLVGVGLALLVMVLNVAASFGWVWVYAKFVAPGHDEAFYMAYAQREGAPMSSIFVGAVLMFAAGWFVGRSRARGRALATAAVIAGTYIVIDAAIILAVGVAPSLWPILAVSFATKLAAALAGAWLSARAAPAARVS